VKTYKLRFGDKKRDSGKFRGRSKFNADDIPDPHIDEVVRKMEPWEVDRRCIRSLKYKHKRDHSKCINLVEQDLKKLKKAQ